MGFLITTLILFAFTLLVPGLASQNEEAKAQAALDRANAEDRALAAARSTNETKLESLKLDRQSLEIDIKRLEAQERLAVEQGRATTGMADAIVAANAALKDFDETNKATIAGLEELANAGDKFADGFAKQMAGLAGISTDASNSLIVGFTQAMQSGEGLKEVMGKVRDSLGTVFTATNVFVSGLRKVVESTIAVAKAQDESISSFIRATGATQDYDALISSTFFNNRQFGVSMEEAGAAAESLYTEMSAFSTLMPAVQNELVQSVALMNEFGIATDISANALDTMTRVLGMNALEAANMSEELVNMAERIGVPPARLMQELSATAPMLAQWGNQTIDVFLELQAAAKATGIEMSGLVGIAAQFNTFEGAAEAAGRLNSLLGGPYLNSIELLNATESERIRMLIQSLELSGRSFDALGRFEKQALASAVGITDMGEASRIFGQSTAEFDAATRAAEQNAAAQRENEERALQAQTAMESLTAMMQSFAISVRPLVEMLTKLFQGISSITSAITGPGGDATGTGGMLGGIGGATMGITALTVGFKVLKFALLRLTGPIGLTISAIGLLAGIFTKRSSPTFSEYIDHAAVGMRDLASSINMVIPRAQKLNKALPTTAISVATIATADTSATLKANVGGLTAAKAAGSIGMKGGIDKLVKSNEQYAKAVQQAMSKETVLKVNNRELGRVTEDIINKKLRLSKESI